MRLRRPLSWLQIETKAIAGLLGEEKHPHFLSLPGLGVAEQPSPGSLNVVEGRGRAWLYETVWKARSIDWEQEPPQMLSLALVKGTGSRGPITPCSSSQSRGPGNLTMWAKVPSSPHNPPPTHLDRP
jgi:hypothetical protein